MSFIVEIKDLSMTYYTLNGELEVLKDINLTVKKGEILALVGPSGCGKSTIMNILSGLLKPTKGQVNISGKIGYMFQRDCLLEWRTIMDNIKIGLEIQKKLTNESIKRIEHLLKTYGLWEFKDSYPRQLSGGMRQRVALIRTLAVNPDILLLDEPFSALDYQTRLLVCDDITKIIRRENKTTIIVTHDISEAISMGDKIAVLSKRPATIKSIHDIILSVNEVKTPMSAREAPEFKDYFNMIWKELEIDDKTRLL
ncbi:NitT/TauT family transport system ATP-binding protein [Alkalithermobacter thermoalcaliphilus JW-YL-7 = DSM 7308]|uniref:Fe(3+)-transporting ATPase n=1 Tax=Alkalithermobacter thermoalcaliphilus JW-YL-7 = DSM 7308 TaxID=1121328 RepID=A0A150FRW3_CLOPD|nr:Fe(3+)-transporting ATPase [[Clostridium] paradoxum JW-YL-7 = DSM 7308]SHK37704.1 NitT/TauT family transport system ATP-binding protein [[Clostridium] paradoxum JW-YL-7 = DSM 7308]